MNSSYLAEVCPSFSKLFFFFYPRRHADSRILLPTGIWVFFSGQVDIGLHCANCASKWPNMATSGPIMFVIFGKMEGEKMEKNPKVISYLQELYNEQKNVCK